MTIKWLGQLYRPATRLTAVAPRFSTAAPRTLFPMQLSSWAFSGGFLPAQPGAPLVPICGGASLTTEQARARALALVQAVTGAFGFAVPAGCSAQAVSTLRQQWSRSPPGAQFVVYGFRSGVHFLTQGPVTKSAIF